LHCQLKEDRCRDAPKGCANARSSGWLHTPEG
jgi:hypothetical protein